MKNQLYVHDDADPKLKENIKLCQRMLDNMLEFKPKADAGTLALSDLALMVKRNKEVIGSFPKGDPINVGLPANMNSSKQLAEVTASRALESSKLAGGSKPVLKVDSVKDLHNLCTMPPESLANKVSEAAKEMNKKEEKKGEPEVASVSYKLPAERFDCSLYEDHLIEIVSFLVACKQIFYNLTIDWPQISGLEHMVDLHLDALEEHDEEAVEFFLSYINDDVDDEEIEEKQPGAAFALTSLSSENRKPLDTLIACLREDEEKEALVVQALKYGKNIDINEQLKNLFPNEDPHVQKAIVEVLEYREGISKEELELWNEGAQPPVKSKILRGFSNKGIKVDLKDYKTLLENPGEPFYDEALFSALLQGELEAIYWCRKQAMQKPEDITDLPVFLACSGNQDDFKTILSAMDTPNSKESAVLALGLMGLPQAVTILIEALGKEEFLVQRKITDSLELVTGACLELPFPEIIEGPKGKEHEVKVETGWQKVWADWWAKHVNQFDDGIRYRRGRVFRLESCIHEMDYGRGNYWSRQYSYYELQIRSGAHVCHFEADWYVKDQLASIRQWKEWWGRNQNFHENSPWLFAGEPT